MTQTELQKIIETAQGSKQYLFSDGTIVDVPENVTGFMPPRRPLYKPNCKPTMDVCGLKVLLSDDMSTRTAESLHQKLIVVAQGINNGADSLGVSIEMSKDIPTHIRTLAEWMRHGREQGPYVNVDEEPTIPEKEKEIEFFGGKKYIRVKDTLDGKECSGFFEVNGEELDFIDKLIDGRLDYLKEFPNKLATPPFVQMYEFIHSLRISPIEKKQDFGKISKYLKKDAPSLICRKSGTILKTTNVNIPEQIIHLSEYNSKPDMTTLYLSLIMQDAAKNRAVAQTLVKYPDQDYQTTYVDVLTIDPWGEIDHVQVYSKSKIKK
ncbi:hypothetical protein HOK51_01195 [Candidatus Woesearchaeota archaeon]|jgi:hypothetical protein|nr:hypothetical protein [Candidatus Woesearchaeota archaeon]MBT7366579.1 hypothetical protein [Candidatus Woesearchaeota archaeon]